MNRAGIAVALLSAAGVTQAVAQAGALDECYRAAADRTQVTPCLREAQRAATSAMLDAFLAAQKEMTALEQVTQRPGAVARLTQSQRDFERYLRSHCDAVEASFSSGSGAGQAMLGCEVDLLRQRAAALAVFGGPT